MFSEYMEDTLTQSLETLEPERMKDAANAVFEIAKNSGIKSLKDINIKNYRSLIPAAAEMKKLVDSDADDIPVIVRTLAKSMVDSMSVEKIVERSMPEVMSRIDELAEKIKNRNDENSES